MPRDDFDRLGYATRDDILSPDACAALADRSALENGEVGSRSLLAAPWCADLARRLRDHRGLAGLVPPGHVAVQCTRFEKSRERNWLVPIHQDRSIPVARRVDHPALRGWSAKDGTTFVQPPAEVLETLVAVRVHLDPCAIDDGPLVVVPGSHRRGILTPEEAVAARGEEVACPVGLGGALAMRPLILHRSSKATGEGRRRVLHFLFGPPALPFGLAWAETA